jgi:7-cyano-7-deazaguanine reductase
MKHTQMTPDQSELGKKAIYDPYYDANKLFPIPRKAKRDEIGIMGALPFYGVDIWNHYEVSWLDPKGKPIVALAEIRYDCKSPCIIESKSMKLYFNSFNNTSFDTVDALCAVIQKDIAERIGSEVLVQLTPLHQLQDTKLHTQFDGQCLDELEITCSTYLVQPSLLVTSDHVVEEIVHSNLLKSNCLVTNQPDWGSVQIAYQGKQIIHENLLRYLVSFRNHNEFHEQCIERIFVDIMNHCQPQTLTVYGRYTRRGGIDINPYRSTELVSIDNIANPRLSRQ